MLQVCWNKLNFFFVFFVSIVVRLPLWLICYTLVDNSVFPAQFQYCPVHVCCSKYFVRRSRRMTWQLSCMYHGWHVNTAQLMLCHPLCPSLPHTLNPRCQANGCGLWLTITRCSLTFRNYGWVHWFCWCGQTWQLEKCAIVSTCRPMLVACPLTFWPQDQCIPSIWTISLLTLVLLLQAIFVLSC